MTLSLTKEQQRILTTSVELREEFEERAAIMQYANHWLRERAEREAFRCVMRRVHRE